MPKNERELYGNYADDHARANVTQLDYLLEEGLISPKDYRKRVEKVARKFGYRPNDLVPGIEHKTTWHLYSAQAGLDATFWDLMNDGHAAFGVNGLGRIVPIDGITQILNLFEDSLSRTENAYLRAFFNGSGSPLISLLRAIYDRRAPEIAKTYPLAGRLFEIISPIIGSLLGYIDAASRAAYKTPEEMEEAVADLILSIEKGRSPTYVTQIPINGKNVDYALVYPTSGTNVSIEPEWFNDITQRNALICWIEHLTDDLSVHLIADDLRTGNNRINSDLPQAVIPLKELCSQFTRPNGRPLAERELRRFPIYRPESLFIGGGGGIAPPGLFHPHLALVRK